MPAYVLCLQQLPLFLFVGVETALVGDNVKAPKFLMNLIYKRLRGRSVKVLTLAFITQLLQWDFSFAMVNYPIVVL